MTLHRHVRTTLVATTALLIATLAAPGAPTVAKDARHHPRHHDTDRVLLFAADGLRQDIVKRYGRRLPGFAELLRKGASGADGGMLTQAPSNTGAGWYTLATGAWPGVHGSTNNTFHRINQAPSARTGAFDPGVLQAETIAQAAERGGKRVIQMEWAGGRNAVTKGPTVDFRSFFSGRGVATNYSAFPDEAARAARFGVQYDLAAGPLAPATGWTNVPQSHSPALQMHLRVLDGNPPVDKYGLDAYIYDSSDDGRVSYNRVLFVFDDDGKDGSQRVANLRRGQWADVKVTIADGPSAGLTAGMLLKVEELNSSASRVRLFHTSVTRANATWPNWAGDRGYTDFGEFVAAELPTSSAGDFAVLESGVVSEETYVEQGLYWEKLHQPLLKYMIRNYKPDLALVGYPVTDEFQHQFLGLVSPTLPNGAANPAFDDVEVNGTPDGRVDERERFLRRAYEGADATMRIAQKLLEGRHVDLTTFAGSDHGFAPQFLAVDASKVLVDLGLLKLPQVTNCRPQTVAAGETIGKAKACWAGGTVQIYLNIDDLNPATPPPDGYQQIPPNQVAATIANLKAAFGALQDPNDWTGDGQPEGWKVIDRMYTRAEARAIPNGPGTTANMAHPTRTGDLVVFSFPPYQFDAATPGTLIARSEFFGQHGYVPDVQDLPDNINMRATFLAGGDDIERGRFTVRSIDVAPTIAYLMGVPMPQHSQGRVLLELLEDGDDVRPVTIIGLNDFHGQLDPTTFTVDGIASPVGGASRLATLFDEEAAGLPGPALLLAGGDNVGASPPNSALIQDRPAIDVENAWGMDATSYGNHEFDFGVARLLQHQARADFPFLATNIVETATGQRPSWVTPSVVFTVNGVRVGVIGSALETTPELVAAGNTEGLTFLPSAPAIAAESRRLRRQGIKVQVVVIHEGTAVGSNAVDGTPPAPWEGPIIGIAEEIGDTTVDAVVAGHTHRVSNLMVGDILVTEGINAGASYSVLQLMVEHGDVQWAGGATRVAYNIGVAPRPDVQAIVDAANAETAPLRNQVIGTNSTDLLRDGSRLNESAMGDLIADAMRATYPEAEAAIMNSGGLRADIRFQPIPPSPEAPGEITYGEVFAVLPFGNATVIETLTGAQLQQALLNGFSPVCNPQIATGRFPQVSGLVLNFRCNGATPEVTGMWKAPNGPGGPLTPIGPADTVRFVTNDFMYTGGDGYTVFFQGTDVEQTGDLLLDITIDHIAASSPVAAAVPGNGICAPPNVANPAGTCRIVRVP